MMAVNLPALSNSRILVTGGAGFIGSTVAEEFLTAGWTVSVVDDFSTGHRTNLTDERIKIYEASILDRPALESVFDEFQPTHLSHHAAQVSVRRSLENPAMDAEVNILGTLNLAELAVKHQLKQFIFASSGGAIYGEIAAPYLAREIDKTQPTSPYGLSKLADEQYLNWYAAQHKLAVTILRYGNVYGPKQDPAGEAGVVSLFMEAWQAGNTAKIYGTGQQARDFVFVTDVARANRLAAESGKTGVYNIGYGSPLTINQLYQVLAEVWQTQTGTVLKSPKLSPAIAGEIFRSALNTEKANRELGWRAEVMLGEGLVATVKSVINN